MSSILGSTDSTSTAAAATTKSATDKAKLNEDLNKFLTLLTTQLKHQDPLSPMDATEFTSQLVQFAQVEQSIYVNSNLEKLITLQNTTLLSSVAGYLGKDVQAESSYAPLADGELNLSYQLPSKASAVTITVQNEAGSVVYMKEGDTAAGWHDFAWDGKNMYGLPQDEGPYKVTVSALDSSGSPLDVVHIARGTVTGASTADGATTLYMGKVAINLDKVVAIHEPDS